jgi:putative DNA primase/helicase
MIYALNSENAFKNAMKDAGITPPEHINPDGNFQRFSTNGKGNDKSGWCLVINQGLITFGDFRQGVTHTFRADGGKNLKTAETIATQAKIAQARAAWNNDREKVQRAAAMQAVCKFNEANIATSHPYLTLKGVSAHGTRTKDGKLIVPLYDRDSLLATLQFINADGSKQYLKGGKKKGSFFKIGELKNNEPILICEGFATGASLYECTGLVVVVAFDAGNLEEVARAIRFKHPHSDITICADDDAFSDINVGVQKAMSAARLYSAKVCLPRFKNRDRQTDFNDLHRCEGAAAVIACVASAVDACEAA